MTVQEFDPVRAVLRALPLVLSVALVGGLLLGYVYGVRDPEYTSSTRVLFAVTETPEAAGGSGVTLSGPDAERALNSQLDVVTSDAVVTRLQSAVRLPPAVVRRTTTVSVEEGSNVIAITATADSPVDARELAGGLAEAYAENSREAGRQQLRAQAEALQPAIDALSADLAAAGGESAAAFATRNAIQNQLVQTGQQQQQLRAAAATYGGQVDVLSAATTPSAPSSPGRARGAAEGAVLGLLLGSLLALLLEQRRTQRAVRQETADLPRVTRSTAAAS